MYKESAFPAVGVHCEKMVASCNHPVGCGKVNCGYAAREGALGYDLGAPNVAHMHAHNRRGEHCSP